MVTPAAIPKIPEVLVVDDDESVRAIIHAALAAEGFIVRAAEHGAAAVSYVIDHRPDIILMDVVMPVMDGFEACRRIRCLPGGKHIPIIMATGLDDPDSIEKAYKAGATNFVIKPINSTLISHQVEYTLRSSRAFLLLQGREKQLRKTQKHAKIGSWRLDASTLQASWSDEVFKILGCEPIESVNLTELCRFVHPDDLPGLLRSLKNALKNGSTHHAEYRICRPDGSIRWLDCHGEPELDHTGYNGYMTGFVQDISERKAAEEKIKSSLAEKEVLLREIHHRVKNNLQVVSSLLSLQVMRSHNRETIDALQESCRRVQVMAEIHNKLYRSSDLSNVKIDALTRSLAEELARSFDLAPRVRLVMQLEPISIDIARAIPCGQIISELLSNALKHAFPGTRGGTITILLKSEEEQITMSISDDGIGMPDALDFEHCDSVGLQIVRALTEQLEGVIELKRNRGTTYQLIF